MLFCLDDLKIPFFRHNLGFEPALSRALHSSPDALRIHTNSSKLFHIVILHLKALFELYALWPAVFDGMVR